MARLSSCYFCGTAIDAPLREYPVVPRDLDPAGANDETVVLCPACHRKLSTVLEHVIDAVDADDPRRSHPRRGDRAGESDRGRRSGRNARRDRRQSGDRRADRRQSDAPRGTDEGREPSGDEGREASGGTYDPVFQSDDDGPATFDDAEDGRRGPFGDGTDGRESGRDASSNGDDAAQSNGTEQSPLGLAESGRDAQLETGRNPDDEEEAGVGLSTGTPSTANAPSRSSSPSRTGDEPSTATYNRVMRLLQNREFPVRKSEIAEVATSAYDIDAEDFEAVVDAAVERGVFRESDGMLRSA